MKVGILANVDVANTRAPIASFSMTQDEGPKFMLVCDALESAISLMKLSADRRNKFMSGPSCSI